MYHETHFSENKDVLYYENICFLEVLEWPLRRIKVPRLSLYSCLVGKVNKAGIGSTKICNTKLNFLSF